MKFNMLGDANYAGPVRLSDVYDSEVGDASSGIAASQKALYDAYNSLNSRFKVLKHSASLSGDVATVYHNLNITGTYYPLVVAAYTSKGTAVLIYSIYQNGVTSNFFQVGCADMNGYVLKSMPSGDVVTFYWTY